MPKFWALICACFIASLMAGVLINSLTSLVNLGVKRLKIAGFESTDFRFVEMVASSKLPLVISLGIGFEMNYLDKIFEIANKYGNELTLMHCNNAYPTPMQDAGLKTIQLLTLDSRYKTGFSDHTTSTLTPALAVAIGATVIEKHFTLSKHLPGPDHPFALEPNQLKEMVDLIKQAEEDLANEQAQEEVVEEVVEETITEEYVDVVEVPCYGYTYFDPYYDPYYVSPIWLVPVLLW